MSTRSHAWQHTAYKFPLDSISAHGGLAQPTSTLRYKCPAPGADVSSSSAWQPCGLAYTSHPGPHARRHNAAPRRLYDKAMHQLMQKDDQQIVVMTQV